MRLYLSRSRRILSQMCKKYFHRHMFFSPIFHKLFWLNTFFFAGVENCSEPCLIYTAENRIDAIELASSRVVKLVSNLTFPVNLDVHVSERTLYWSDSNQRVIKRMNMSSGVTKDIITEDHGNVGDLAVEWESRLLYWTDTFYRRIEVSSLDGSKRKVLLAESSSYPAGIAVHPKKGGVKSVKWSRSF